MVKLMTVTCRLNATAATKSLCVGSDDDTDDKNCTPTEGSPVDESEKMRINPSYILSTPLRLECIFLFFLYALALSLSHWPLHFRRLLPTTPLQRQ